MNEEENNKEIYVCPQCGKQVLEVEMIKGKCPDCGYCFNCP